MAVSSHLIGTFPNASTTEAQVIDLISTMEQKLIPNRCLSREAMLYSCYWFPPCFLENSTDSRKHILQFFSKPCSLAGFSLISGKVTQIPNKNGLIPLRLACNCSRLYEKSKKASSCTVLKPLVQSRYQRNALLDLPFTLIHNPLAGCFQMCNKVAAAIQATHDSIPCVYLSASPP